MMTPRTTSMRAARRISVNCFGSQCHKRDEILRRRKLLYSSSRLSPSSNSSLTLTHPNKQPLAAYFLPLLSQPKMSLSSTSTLSSSSAFSAASSSSNSASAVLHALSSLTSSSSLPANDTSACPTEHSGIFTLPDLDMELATWCMVALIGFTVAFEYCLHHIEHQLRSHTHYLKILSKVYKELMILGFISFSILIVLQVFALTSTVSETLEFVHVWFFFIALLYAIHVLVYMWLARRDKRRYDVATYRRIPDLLEGYKQMQLYETTRREKATSGGHYWCRFVVWCWNVSEVSYVSSVLSSIYQTPATRLYAQMQFHIVRSLFIRTYNLPPHFDFAKYLRRCMSKHITEQLDIKETSWLILVLFLIINVVRVYIEETYSDDTYSVVTLWLFLVVPYFLLGLSMCAVVGIERSKRRLLEKVGVRDATDLERALLASRAKTGGNSSGSAATTARSGGGRTNKRASVTTMEQQEALNAYLPLLINGLFPYNRPVLFPKSLEVVMLTQCFFIGLACIFHIRQAFETFDVSIAGLYIVFTMLPHLIVLLVIAPHVMTTYVFVHSVGYVNKEVLEHVNEFMEETDELKREIKTHLQSYLLSAQPSLTLADLFLKLTKGGHVIHVKSLRSVLEDVNVQLTASQTSRLIRMINLGQNGAIDLREFSLFFFGSEGSGALSLVPIRANTTDQLLRVSQTAREEIMDKEIAKGREKVAEKERLANEANDGVVVVEVDGEPLLSETAAKGAAASDKTSAAEEAAMASKRVVDFHPNALHEPDSPHPLPVIPHAITTHPNQSTHGHHTPTTPLSPHSAAAMPMLDLRGNGKAHADTNIFITHTLDHTAHHPSHHHPHAKSQPASHALHSDGANKVGIGRHEVDALDFAACFHGSETVCQRCGHVVLVKQINMHTQQCRIRHDALTRARGIDQTVDLSRLRSGTLPYVDEDGKEGAVHEAGKEAKVAAVASMTIDDIVLNDSKGGSRRTTRASGRQLPLVVGADGKVALKVPALAAVREKGERERGVVLEDVGARRGNRNLGKRASSRRRQSLTDAVP